MGPHQQKRWNLLSAIALLLAAALAVLGISTLNFTGQHRGDSLVLSSAPRHQVLGAASKGVDGWSSLRGTPLRHEELERDSSQADQAKYKVKVGIYTTNTYDLDLSVPSFTANGYVWMRWQEPLQR